MRVRFVFFNRLHPVCWALTRILSQQPGSGRHSLRPCGLSGIFYHDEQQKLAAERSKEQAQKRFQESLVTPVVPVTSFTAAGEEHQDYYKKQPFRYKQYKMRCGREQRLRAIWK